MATVFGVFGAQSLVVLIVAVVGLIPVVLYYQKTPRWFVAAYGFLFVAAFATNFEDLFLPTALNLVEHFIGNLGAGIAFAVAAYAYRKKHIEGDDDVAAAPEA
ncbi:hypothetical protein [Haloplanus aerogenes]|uniref:Uncharacterized protein n=1 Tax=Haloplanus aerogenes TaxID=660522 RepID=A0A3M0CVV3_9EURY|nr:hypothetical protein [Haloplanus aerogenes]AZH23892.1 hypothetical protein DU502_00220 [Haloplanus aerogenes]RMB13348.1 hypothetical protein ATH50_2681 [Haloplanus aerogenes]